MTDTECLKNAINMLDAEAFNHWDCCYRPIIEHLKKLHKTAMEQEDSKKRQKLIDEVHQELLDVSAETSYDDSVTAIAAHIVDKYHYRRDAGYPSFGPEHI